MSTIVISKCWPIEGLTPTQKFVLISLADQANDDGYCWPSVGSISKRTCLSDRAVQLAIKSLVEKGLLQVASRDGRSNVYRVTPPNDVHPEAGSPPNDVHPTPERRSPHPRTTFTPPPNDVHPEPLIEPLSEPLREPNKKAHALGVRDLVALGVDRGHAEDWLRVRKAKRAPLTKTALDGVIKEAGKAGLTLAEVVRICAENSWQGFKADWVKRLELSGGRAAPSRTASRHTGFEYLDYTRGFDDVCSG